MAGFLPNAQDQVGLFVGTTDVWDLSSIQTMDVNSQEFKLLLVRLYQNLNNIVLALNLKDSAYYIKTPFVTGQQFFTTTQTINENYRPSYRIVIETGALAAGTKTVAHGLAVTSSWVFTRIYGVATDSVGLNYYPIPFAGAAGAFISVVVNSTNVIVNNNSGIAFNKSLIVLEYLQS
jgi:hypothetical protein